MIRSSPLLFTVTRREPELIPPAKPLSDVDDQDGLHFHAPFVQFYMRHDVRNHSKNPDRDPVEVVREALAQALVYYYPWEGRLREGSRKKLVVDCTGEGVLFVEARADVRLEDFGRLLYPPFPCFDELLFDVGGSSGILNCPLLLVQVTRLICGGFVVALRCNHTMTDIAGLIQFMNAVAELARGASHPSVHPIWSRHLLCSRDPPRVTCTHREYDQLNGPVFPPLQGAADADNKVVEGSFFFGTAVLSALKRRLNPSLRGRCSSFELLAAFLWRCRTIALRLDPNDDVRYLCATNARPKLDPPLPAGYYGNVSAFPTAVSTAGELIFGGLDYAVELIKKAKAEATEEYVRSVADLLGSRGRPHFTVPGTWAISDASRAGFMEIDFGRGKPVYGGPATAAVGTVADPFGYFVKAENGVGEGGLLLLICLPAAAMERFGREVNVVGGNNGSNSTHLLYSKI